MPKKNNRETTTLGQSTRDRTSLSPPELAQIRDEQVQRENRSRFAELMESEAEAALAKARADDDLLAKGVYPMSADPGTIVGLDGVTPDSDAAVDGDHASPAESSDPS